MIGLTLVEVHFFATDFLKRVVELTIIPVDVFLLVAVVPERVFIIIDVVGTLIVVVGILIVVGTMILVVSGIFKERVFSEFIEEEVLVDSVVPVRIRFVISGSIVLGTTIVSGEIVRVLVLIERAYTENVRNTQ
jgi:hypothetical protein